MGVIYCGVEWSKMQKVVDDDTIQEIIDFDIFTEKIRSEFKVQSLHLESVPG
jgi:hypothetical protein